MFITDDDYRVVIGDSALKVVTQADGNTRTNAELEAMEEVASYLRPKYDVTAIFATEDDDRNRLLVMYTCDIALYHLIASMPQKMGTDIRKERYDRAVKWLEGVQCGKILPDLPLMVDADGEPNGMNIVWNSDKKLRHNW